jgi:16S rRNA (uracil1498-N3)-methyltransferase
MALRYFVDPLPDPGQTSVGGELAHHLGTVLRLRPGDEVELFDGRGGCCRAALVRGSGPGLVLEVAAATRTARPEAGLHVAFAPPRWNRAEWLFEHGTEIGIACFHPLTTARSRPQGERPDRWARIVQAAAGQCGRLWLPEIRAVAPLSNFLNSADLPRRRWLAEPDADAALPPQAQEAVVLVGPEGGFTADERNDIAAAGFVPCRLGQHVLRTETAALVAAALALGR